MKTAAVHRLWQFFRKEREDESLAFLRTKEGQEKAGHLEEVQFTPDDPFLPYLLSASGMVEVEKLQMESPILARLQKEGVKITVPLISQGELVGLLNLGPKLSEQEYSLDDRRLLGNLAAQTSPALRVAQLALQQQSEARERDRMEQELHVARVIQQTLLPQEVPGLQGWQMATYWQPARAVSGDFYDFLPISGGRLAFFAGDVTDKGVPAALVMATTRSVIRSVAEQFEDPGVILARVNDLIFPDIPLKMFVTCLYGVLDPETGRLRFANAGHNLPLLRSSEGVVELRATGMPLGLMPGMTYEEHETILAPGDTLLVYSDGFVEAHNELGEMYGFPRLRKALAELPDDASLPDGHALIERLLSNLTAFTGPGWEQEDDVTFLAIERLAQPDSGGGKGGRTESSEKQLADLNIPSVAGNERLAVREVLKALEGLNLSRRLIEHLSTAVAETTMNAIEHGNQFRADQSVQIQVRLRSQRLIVRVKDHGGGKDIPVSTAPNLEAKLAGNQSSRGWGLFLIQKMVDEMRVSSENGHHTVDLIFNLEEIQDGE